MPTPRGGEPGGGGRRVADRVALMRGAAAYFLVTWPRLNGTRIRCCGVRPPGLHRRARSPPPTPGPRARAAPDRGVCGCVRGAGAPRLLLALPSRLGPAGTRDWGAGLGCVPRPRPVEVLGSDTGVGPRLRSLVGEGGSCEQGSGLVSSPPPGEIPPMGCKL